MHVPYSGLVKVARATAQERTLERATQWVQQSLQGVARTPTPAVVVTDAADAGGCRSVCVCVCVCERERERERECVCVCFSVCASERATALSATASISDCDRGCAC
jgi:hypothetical protein